MVNAIVQAIESFAADVFFGVIVLALLAAAILAALFGLLLVRRAWFRLTCGSWRDVVVSAERRALK